MGPFESYDGKELLWIGSEAFWVVIATTKDCKKHCKNALQYQMFQMQKLTYVFWLFSNKFQIVF